MFCFVYFKLLFFFFGFRMLLCFLFIVLVFKIFVELFICMGIVWWEEVKLILKEKINKDM